MGERYEMNMTQEVSEQIEDLLVTWHYWMQAQRPWLGAPRVSPGFAHADTTDVYEEGDDRDDKINRYQAEQVNVCIDELCFEHRLVIGVHAKNKASGVAVWRNPRLAYLSPEARHAAYQEAKVALMQRLHKRGLIRTVDTVHKQDSNITKAAELRLNHS
jgi:hypothetical protein